MIIGDNDLLSCGSPSFIRVSGVIPASSNTFVDIFEFKL